MAISFLNRLNLKVMKLEFKRKDSVIGYDDYRRIIEAVGVTDENTEYEATLKLAARVLELEHYAAVSVALQRNIKQLNEKTEDLKNARTKEVRSAVQADYQTAQKDSDD